MSNRDLVISYYDACNAGDVNAVVAFFRPDVTHYFLAPNPRSAPLRTARVVALALHEMQKSYDGRWVVDHYLGDDDEAVTEWTLYWTSPKTGNRIVTRGAEFYRFVEGRIAEVRAYYRQRHETSELDGFDYTGRGYSFAENESSAIHRTAGRS